jgi:hypothetical protein
MTTTGYRFLDQLRNDLAELPARRNRVARRARWQVAAVVAGIAVSAAVVALVLTRGGSATVPTASAATFLNTAADDALTTPATVLRPGQFYYEKYHGTNLGPIAGAIGTNERWTSRFGSGRMLYNGHFIAGFTGSATRPAQTAFGNRSLTYAQLQALPTDPDRLADLIRKASTPAGPIGLPAAEYRVIGQLLSGSPWPIPRNLGAGLLRVAATIPGLTITRHTHDCAGRPAVAIVSHERGAADDKPVRMRFALFFNPTTDLFLGEAGTVEGHAHPFQCIALMDAGVVNSMTAKP